MGTRRTTEPTPDRRYLKSIDAESRSAVAVLGYPAIDYDGDWVQPDGGDWSEYQGLVNWNHTIPIGRGSVELKAAKIDGEPWNLPVGTTRFFQTERDTRGIDLTQRDGNDRPVGRYTPTECLDAADDAFRMVADDVAKGVSVEFIPLGTKGIDFKPRGKKSLLTGRDSYEFYRWKGLAYAHALQQKNPGAMTLSPAIEKAIRIAETGRHPGGKVVSPVILKAFASLKSIPRPARVRVENLPMPRNKAFGDDDDFDTADTDVVDAPADEPVDDVPADGSELPDMKPTPMLFSLAVQSLKDVAAQLKEGIDGGAEHVDGIARLQAVVDEINGIAEELLADGRTMFPDAGLDAPDDTAEDEAAMPLTDDGALIGKAFKKGFPVRFKSSDLKPIAPAEPQITESQSRQIAVELARTARLLKRTNHRLNPQGR